MGNPTAGCGKTALQLCVNPSPGCTGKPYIWVCVEPYIWVCRESLHVCVCICWGTVHTSMWEKPYSGCVGESFMWFWGKAYIWGCVEPYTWVCRESLHVCVYMLWNCTYKYVGKTLLWVCGGIFHVVLGESLHLGVWENPYLGEQGNLWLTDIAQFSNSSLVTHCCCSVLSQARCLVAHFWLETTPAAWHSHTQLCGQGLGQNAGGQHQRRLRMKQSNEFVGVISIALKVVSWRHCPVQDKCQQFPVHWGCRLHAWLACALPQWRRWSHLSQRTYFYQRTKISHPSHSTQCWQGSKLKIIHPSHLYQTKSHWLFTQF